MTETLAVLIKVAERKVDAAQLALNQTREALAQCRARMDELVREAEAAFADAVGENDVVALQAALAFDARIRRDLADLKQVETAMQGQENAQCAQLQELFAGQKTYELLHERQQLAARKAKAKKAQAALDDVAGRRR